MKLNLQAAIDGKLDNELNLALCEWRGWGITKNPDGKGEKWTGPNGEGRNGEGCYGWGYNDSASISELPNHITAPESLGLVHEVEKKLQNQELAYQDNLAGIVDAGDASTYWWEACHYRHRLITATARQRVIAILQTVKPEIFE